MQEKILHRRKYFVALRKNLALLGKVFAALIGKFRHLQGTFQISQKDNRHCKNPHRFRERFRKYRRKSYDHQNFEIDSKSLISTSTICLQTLENEGFYP